LAGSTFNSRGSLSLGEGRGFLNRLGELRQSEKPVADRPQDKHF